MELVERTASSMTGVAVTGAFDELSSRVPAAWRSLAAAGAPRDATYAELSRSTADGTYLEHLGLLDDEVLGAHRLAERLGGVIELERVPIPAGAWVRYHHEGPEEEIAVSFGRMIAWAKAADLEPTGELLDVGYRFDSARGGHELWVKVEPAALTGAG